MHTGILVAGLFLLAASTLATQFSALEKVPTGLVDDCCCSVTSVDKVNDDYILNILDALVNRRFFKYYKVNLDLECPFWVVSKTCGLSGGCSVCECDANEVPLSWKTDTTDIVDRSIGSDFNPWVDQQEPMWFEKQKDSESIYVDLTKNPELNTGYVGPEANRVWMAIYKENCFSGDSECVEERVFYRLISGFHSSITAHIFYKFHKQADGTYTPDLPGFIKTLGAFPERIKNLYFTYLFLLRAVNRATPFLENYNYDTGNPEGDAQTKQLVQQLLHLKKNGECSIVFDGFNDRELFASDKVHLKHVLQNKFRNVSSILNCIACESCRLQARLKILGLGTALKVLFSDAEHVSLQRNEIIALVNSLQQLANSLRIVNHMNELRNIPMYLVYLRPFMARRESEKAAETTRPRPPQPSPTLHFSVSELDLLSSHSPRGTHESQTKTHHHNKSDTTVRLQQRAPKHYTAHAPARELQKQQGRNPLLLPNYTTIAAGVLVVLCAIGAVRLLAPSPPTPSSTPSATKKKQ